METTTLVLGIVGTALGALASLGAILNALRVKDIEKFKTDLKTKADKELESYRSTLQIETNKQQAILTNQADKEIERFKSELQIESHEQQLALNNLQERRATAIDEIYKALVQTENALKDLTSPSEFSAGPSKEERAKVFVAVYNSFVQLYEGNRIYLSETTCDQLQEFVIKFRVTYIEFEIFVMDKVHSKTKESLGKWDEAFNTASKEIPELRVALEEELRSILTAKVSDLISEPQAEAG